MSLHLGYDATEGANRFYRHLGCNLHIFVFCITVGEGSLITKLKGALDKFNIIPQLFPKKLGIIIPLEVLA